MSSHDIQTPDDTSRAGLQLSDIVDWTDAQMDEAFRRAETVPLGSAWTNAGGHEIDLERHELYNDAHWKGFLAKDTPIRGVMERLSTGYGKRFWKQRSKVLGETLYVNGAILVKHALEDITIDQPVNDLEPGRYVLLRYTDPVFEHIFYDVMKLVSPDLILYRGYTGRFPEGRRGLTAPLCRRYGFAHMGLVDHERLSTGGTVPTEHDMVGAWRLDAIDTSNHPVSVAHVQFERANDGGLRGTCEATANPQNLVTPPFVLRHFDSEPFPTLQGEILRIDANHLVGRWTTDISGPFAKMLLSGSLGLFHAERAKTRPRKFSLYYVLTRT